MYLQADMTNIWRRMSKRLNNYPAPGLVIDKYGSDALRLYLINSPVVRAETLRFQEPGVRDVIARVLLPLWNSYKFFNDQVLLLKKVENVDFEFDPKTEALSTNIMDKWILASCQSLLKFVNQEMAGMCLLFKAPSSPKMCRVEGLVPRAVLTFSSISSIHRRSTSAESDR